MAMSKGSYYKGEGPEIPSAGGDYGHPTPHAAHAAEDPFEAPSTDAAILGQNDTSPSGGAGLDAIVTAPKVTKPGGKDAAVSESQAFNPRPTPWGD